MGSCYRFNLTRVPCRSRRGKSKRTVQVTVNHCARPFEIPQELKNQKDKTIAPSDPLQGSVASGGQ